jgi:hypothetical protein
MPRDIELTVYIYEKDDPRRIITDKIMGYPVKPAHLEAGLTAIESIALQADRAQRTTFTWSETADSDCVPGWIDNAKHHMLKVEQGDYEACCMIEEICNGSEPEHEGSWFGKHGFVHLDHKRRLAYVMKHYAR